MSNHTIKKKITSLDLNDYIKSLILIFMFLKAGLIMAFFMHLFWERYAIVNVLLWPLTAIACFIGLMVAEGKYTLFSRFFYFFVGGG